MGNPRFYYYPDDTGSLEAVDLGEALSDLQETPGAVVSDAYGGDRTPYRMWHASTFQVRITLERFGSPSTNSVERKLQTLQAHLQRGGVVGFSRDQNKTWAALRTGTATRGDAIFYTPGSGFAGWSSLATLASGDEIVIEDLAGHRELNTVSALGATGDITLGNNLVYTYEGHPLVRWRDFYPVLSLPASEAGRSFITSDRRRNWTLEVTLEYSIAAALALWGDSYADPYGMLGGFSMRDGDGLGGLGLEELLPGRLTRAGRTTNLGRFRGGGGL